MSVLKALELISKEKKKRGGREEGMGEKRKEGNSGLHLHPLSRTYVKMMSEIHRFA